MTSTEMTSFSPSLTTPISMIRSDQLLDVTPVSFTHTSSLLYRGLVKAKAEDIGCIISSLFIVIGVFSNTVTIITFLRLGFEDGIAICFFHLAFADLIILLWHFLFLMSRNSSGSFGVRLLPIEVTSYSTTVSDAVHTSASVLTCFLAVQRCLCVLRPLHFRGLFTKFRTHIAMMALWGYCLIDAAVPLMFEVTIRYWLVHRRSIPDHTPYLIFFKRIQRGELILRLTKGLVIRPCSIIVISICVFIMAHVLRKSFEFRKSATNFRRLAARDCHSKCGKTSKEEEEEQKEEQDDAYSKQRFSSSKERKAIIQVALVSTIFIVASFKDVRTAASVFMGNNIRYGAVYIEVCHFVAVFSSAVNFFIYYKFNSRFRKICFSRSPLSKKMTNALSSQYDRQRR